MRLAPRRALIGALAATLLLPVAVLVFASSAQAQSTTRIRVDDNLYVPPEVTITAGDSVTWVWRGENPHSVTSPGGGFDSHPSCSPATPGSCGTQGSAYTVAFDTPGEYDYVCRVHGAEMTGTIVVEEPAEPSPEPSPSEPDPSEGPGQPTPPESTPTEPPGTELPSEDPPDDPTPSPTEPSPSEPAEPSPSEPAEPSEPSPQPPEPSPEPSPTPPPRPPEPEPAPAEPEDAEPDLIPFPSPQAGPPGGNDAPDEVAIDVPGDGGGGAGRLLWLAVASLGVLGSAGAFGSVVLFGPPWEG